MNDREIGHQMYQMATDFVRKRFPTGWGGCAVLFTEDRQFLISVALESFNAGAGLCMETGAMCEAQKFNLRVTHSLCVSRNFCWMRMRQSMHRRSENGMMVIISVMLMSIALGM